jgi:hypothetical protein
MSHSCLMVHNYFGPRRVYLQEYVDDPLFYAKKQIEFLQKYKHSLSKIYFTVNQRGLEDDPYIFELKKILPSKIQNASVELLLRPNIGLSYGAFSDIFKENRLKYDYYFFTEDDYLFVQDDFDKILIDMFNRYENAGYVSALVREESTVFPVYPKHAGIQMGVTSSAVLEELFNKFGGSLPHNDKPMNGLDYSADETIGNVGQTNQIYKMGYELYDVRESYTSYVVMPWPYLRYEQWFEDKPDEIISPIQRVTGKMYPIEVKS